MKSLYLSELKGYLRYFDLPGSEPVCVYLHGLGCASSADYPPVIVRSPLNGYRSLLVDFLGFGYSDRPETFTYSLEDHARMVAELLNHLQLNGCVLIGHSMGGSVAITLAADRPHLASALVVAEGNLDPGVGTISTEIASYTEQEYIRNGHGRLLRATVEDALAGDTGMAAYAVAFHLAHPLAVYRSAVGLLKGTQPTMRERLLQFTIPKAYVFGERNLPDPDQQALAKNGVDVLVIPDAGHAMMEENPRGFAQVIGGWLGKWI